MKTNKYLPIIFVMFVTVQSCTGQTNEKKIPCNRKTADQSLSKRLPSGICIPGNNTVDEIITNVDFNRDTKRDVIVRYSEYPLKNGIHRYYALLERRNDTTFLLKKELKNIIPPYLKNIYAAASGTDSLSKALVHMYPYDLKIEFTQDTIKLSHLIPDYYGKTYDFVFEAKRGNWYLKQTKYWIGGLDERDIEQMNLSPGLSKRNTIETKIPEEQISIEKFNLLESRRVADNEEKDYLTEKFNLLEWSQKNK